MEYRKFGSTGMMVSEVGFGAWAIGGTSYGAVEPRECLRALARAEELGCNFIDTAEVYGDSELIVGKFLAGRRDRWLVATKYSAQKEGIRLTAERQLRQLGTDTIDFYQIHWVPKDQQFYEDLYQLKRSGKVRFVGVSLYTANDIDYVLNHTDIDGFQVCLSLLDPDPYLARLAKIREKNVGVIIRSCLKGGFLTGKYTRDATFTDPKDQRHKWSRREIARTVESVDKFRFLEGEAGSMVVAAARYTLSFPETSTVVLSTKTAAQAEINFGRVPGRVLSDQSLERIRAVQRELGFGSQRFLRRMRGILGKARRKLFWNRSKTRSTVQSQAGGGVGLLSESGKSSSREFRGGPAPPGPR